MNSLFKLVTLISIGFLTTMAITVSKASHHQQQKRLFNGDKVVRLFPASKSQVTLLNDLINNARTADDRGQFLDYWSGYPKAVGRPVDIYVRRDKMADIASFFDLASINFKIVIDDVQAMMDKVDEDNGKFHTIQKRGATAANSTLDIVGKFVSYEDMVKWLAAQCIEYPAITECGSYGKSFEKRDLRYIRVGRPNSTSNEKRGVFIEAGIHAREHLTPATIVFIINEMLTNYENDETMKSLLDSYEFYFIPSANPDGYEYSRTTDRLWRKTRSNATSLACLGVDGNRNFDIRWGTASSSDPCDRTYHGAKAFSEPETQGISDLIMNNRQKWLAYFSIHAYSQLWLVPYGYDVGVQPEDYEELTRVANIGGTALMAINGRVWHIGNTVDMMNDSCSGSSDDWAKGIAGIKYSYTLELFPDTSSTLNGFVVGRSEIAMSGREVLAGIRAAVEAMKPPTTDNLADPVVVLGNLSLQAFFSDDDDYTFASYETQLLVDEVDRLYARVDKLDSTYTASIHDLHNKVNKLEQQLQAAEATISKLVSSHVLLRRAVATTRTRQVDIERRQLQDELVLVLLPTFVPHVVSKESLLGVVVNLSEDIDERFLNALRHLDLEKVTQRPKKFQRTRTNWNGTIENVTEIILHFTHLREQQRTLLLSQEARNVTEKAGFWFEAQLPLDERHAKRALEAKLHYLQTKYGNSLRYTLKPFRLVTNHGIFYYDIILRRLLRSKNGR